MKRLVFGVAVFILGFIIGASLTGVSVGRQVDELYIKNRTLMDRLTVTEKELQQLKQTSQARRSRLIVAISTQVSFPDECDYSEFEKSTIELTVERKVREWLKAISGQEVESVNHLLVPRIVDNREIEVEGKKIRLKVNLVVISEKVIVYLEIVPLKNKV